VQKFSDGQSVSISKEAMDIFKQYHWPGNVRELKNMGERLAIVSEGRTVTPNLIPHEIRRTEQANICDSLGAKGLEQIISETEITAIKCALEKKMNNKTKAAELLHLPLSTLRSKMEKYGL